MGMRESTLKTDRRMEVERVVASWYAAVVSFGRISVMKLMTSATNVFETACFFPCRVVRSSHNHNGDRKYILPNIDYMHIVRGERG